MLDIIISRSRFLYLLYLITFIRPHYTFIRPGRRFADVHDFAPIAYLLATVRRLAFCARVRRTASPSQLRFAAFLSHHAFRVILARLLKPPMIFLFDFDGLLIYCIILYFGSD